jgi:hypothetical protein
MAPELTPYAAWEDLTEDSVTEARAAVENWLRTECGVTDDAWIARQLDRVELQILVSAVKHLAIFVACDVIEQEFAKVLCADRE